MTQPPPPGGAPHPAPPPPPPGPQQPYWGPTPPGYGTAPGHPPNPQRPHRKSLLIGAVAGFALAAVIALVLAVTGVLPSTSTALNSSSDSITLPSTVGDYRFEIDALKARKAPGAAAIIRLRATSRERTAAALSKAYGGAGADVRFYATSDFRSLATIAAIRADSPRVTTVYDDPKESGLAVPLQQVQTFGSVDCLVLATIATPAGQTPGPRSSAVSACQRTGGGLTVRILWITGVDGVRPQTIAALVDEIWTKLH